MPEDDRYTPRHLKRPDSRDLDIDPGVEEIGGEPCGDLEPGDENLPLARPPGTVDRWSFMLVRQSRLQQESYGITPHLWPAPEVRADYVKTMVLALEDELHEALGEIDWKSWATGGVFNRDAYLKELIDAFHFLMNLMLVARLGYQDEYDLAAEVVQLYHGKAQVNANRQASGTYDGRSTKCPDCGRAIEDGKYDGPTGQYRCQCGKLNYLAASV